MIVKGADQFKGKVGKAVLNEQRKDTQDAVLVSPAGVAKAAASAASPPPSASKKRVREVIDVEDENNLKEMLVGVMETAKTAMKTQEEEKKAKEQRELQREQRELQRDAVQAGVLSALQALAAAMAPK
jgi:C4-dicarboxylate-specific signal transduction histidine kinase